MFQFAEAYVVPWPVIYVYMYVCVCDNTYATPIEHMYARVGECLNEMICIKYMDVARSICKCAII